MAAECVQYLRILAAQQAAWELTFAARRRDIAAIDTPSAFGKIGRSTNTARPGGHDNKDAAESLALFLGSQGHVIRVEHDPICAIAAVHEDTFDVLVLDIGLPSMDGYSLARQMRALPGRMGAKYIALTGYGSDSDRQRGDEAGFDHYLVKPADLDELGRLIEQA